MKKISEIYKELGIALRRTFRLPIRIKDARGKVIYSEDSRGFWYKCEYDANGNRTYYETSTSFWHRIEYDSKGNQTYYENSCGHKIGTSRSATCEGKVVEVDGTKYKLTAL